MNIKNTLFWFTSITLAFFVGYFAKTSHQVETGSSIPQAQLSRVIEAEQNSSELADFNLKSKGIVNEEAEEKNSSLDNKAIMSKVNELLDQSALVMDLSSIIKSYILIENFSEQDVNDALNELQGDLSSTKNAMVVNLLISRYAEINPYGAVAFIENNIKGSNVKQQYLSAAVSTWAKKDPSSAYYWAKENDSEQIGFMSSYKYVSIFNGLAKQDMNDAFSKLNEMADKGQSTTMAAMGVANTLENSEQFTEFYQNSKNLDNDGIMRTAISTWVNKDPHMVTDWITSVEAGKDKTIMEETILNTWLTSEPSSAAEWYMNENNGDDRQASANKIATSWGMKGPKQALEWINQQSDIDSDMSTTKLLESSVYLNTQFTMDNLSLLNNENSKQKISRKIYYSLKRKNKKKAESFLNDSAYKGYILKKRQKRSSR